MACRVDAREVPAMMHFRIDGCDYDVLADEDVRDLLNHLMSDAASDCPNRNRLVQFFARCTESDGTLSIKTVRKGKTRGGISLSKADALGRRDAMLFDLWRSHPDFRDLAPYAAGDVMARNALRYEAGRWLRECDKIIPPLKEPEATWWKILRSGGSVPRSRQLGKILSAGRLAAPPS